MTKQTLNEQINEIFEDANLEKALALAEHLGLDLNEEETIFISNWSEKVFLVLGHEYMVLNEEERQTEVTNHIENSLWAFTSSFLAQETDSNLLPVFEALQKADLYEGANDAILAIIEKFSSLEDFVESATDADGYGHYIASYDHEENESDCGNYFIYRQN